MKQELPVTFAATATAERGPPGSSATENDMTTTGEEKCILIYSQALRWAFHYSKYLCNYRDRRKVEHMVYKFLVIGCDARPFALKSVLFSTSFLMWSMPDVRCFYGYCSYADYLRELHIKLMMMINHNYVCQHAH